MALSNGEATLTVRSDGKILFDSAAIAAFDLRHVQSVAVVYSVATQRLVIRPVTASEAGIRLEHRRNGIHLPDSGGFLRDLGLLNGRKRRCRAHWDTRAELIIVQISQVKPMKF